MKTALLLLFLLPLTACDDEIFNPEAVTFEDLRRMEPPPEYRAWFSEVAVCMRMADADTDARFNTIQWYSAAHIYLPKTDVAPWGIWQPPHTIVVRADLWLLLAAEVVRHEIIHELSGQVGHDFWYFDACEKPG